MFHVGTLTDGETDLKKQVVAYRNSVNASKMNFSPSAGVTRAEEPSLVYSKETVSLCSLVEKCSSVQPEEKEISKITSMFNIKHHLQNYLKFYFSTFNNKMCLSRSVFSMFILCVRSIK